MKIAVFGGTGRIGSAVVEEALSRGHQVEVISRHSSGDDRADAVVGSLFDPTCVDEARKRNDVVVLTIPPSREGGDHTAFIEAHAYIADSLLSTPVLVVGGAGSLRAGEGYLKDQENFPERLRSEASTMVRVLELYQEAPNDNWTILCPPPQIAAGPRTGNYALGEDFPAGQGISIADFSVALLDEIETPKNRGRRFTVANDAA